ncbi:MAG: FHA domain-containing protein [Lachnospiraceae bacterium]|nr:FHA domain-containing protein [Lachnospiraceae bacterium]
MKNITYENQGNNTYLVYEIYSADIIDNLSLGMINNNKIIGLAPVIYSQVDNKKYLKYNISAKVSAAAFLAGAASRNRILGVFSSVSKALLSAEEYMLDANTIMLDLDYIYVDVTTCEAELICLPIQRGNFNDVVSFFKNIIFSVTYDQTENCDYVAKIIGCLNSHSSFSLQNFMQTIDELNGKRINIQNLQNNQQVEPEPNYTEILHGESQEIKSAAKNLQRVNTVQSPIYSQPVQNNGSYPYNNMQTQPPMQSQGESAQNYYSSNQPTGNQSNIPPNNEMLSGYQPVRRGTMTPNQIPSGGPVMTLPNQKQSKKQKAEKKNKKGQMSPLINYTVPGAPSSRTGMPMQGPGTVFQGKTEKQQKKSGGLSGLFHKKNKPENIPPNSISRPQMPPHNTGNIPSNNINRNQQIPNNMGNMSNGMNPNQQIPNSMGNMPNRMNQNQQMQNGMVNTMSQMSGQYNMNNVPNGMNQQINPQYASQSMENTNPQYTGRSMNFGETTVLDGNMTNGETSVLSAPAVVQPYLLRKKNGEKIFINNPFFRIGKEANYVDYFIGDNSAISRSHANIINSGKEYYIIDTNSKNHTYVNGQMIQSNTETLLTHGSIVKLANEEFEFRMY